MDIKCKKNECKFNKNCNCLARHIKIGEGVDCETYEYSQQNAIKLKEQTSENMFEISNVNSKTYNKNTTIYCNAKCLFNNKGLCNANGITVKEKNTVGECPCCVTQIDE